MDLMKFVEDNRVKQGMTKKELCAGADISVQYYDKLIKGISTESRIITVLLFKKLGFALVPIPFTCLD
jgi:transcriptional regulator with XRE-family HTH domain